MNGGESSVKAEINEKDCELEFKSEFSKDVAIFFTVQSLVYAYLILVLYSHWKNSDLPVTEGGLIPIAPK